MFCTKETLHHHHHLSFYPSVRNHVYTVFAEICRRIAVYKKCSVYFSRCLFVQEDEGYLKKTHRSVIILHGTHIKTKHIIVHEMGFFLSTAQFLLETFIQLHVSQRAKGSSEKMLPLFWAFRCADLGQTAR